VKRDCGRRFARRSISTSNAREPTARERIAPRRGKFTHHSLEIVHVQLRLAFACLVFASGGAAAQQSLIGYTPANAATETALERSAVARPSPTNASTMSKALSIETHVSGTPAQARTRDYVIAQMRQWGIDTNVRQYDVWMPHAVSVRAWRISPAPREFALAEPPVAGDPSSRIPQFPTVNGYSGEGDVTADLVYVNYGLIEDYAQLDAMGISVKGKIAIARYGRSFRGIKAREAEKHGAIGLFIYSDPQDDGYFVDDVYPQGPARSANGVQRGSILNADGDPSTPGYASVAGARRIPVANMEISHIPVVPIGYGNASELLKYLGGPGVPRGWQGGLAFHYHVGPGPVKARLVVKDDRATHAIKPIFDTFGVIRGSQFPDELVIVGGHRDAWGPGAGDNVSGTVSILESARAIAEEVKAGHRPKRTIVFATWDAEEWGLLGSTEYVEDDSLRLAQHAVAYFNQDEAAEGPRFNGGGSPSLRATLRDVARLVPDPNGAGSVYEQWRKATGVAAGAEPRMGDPGGGSDFAGFYNHLGIPIADWGFGGSGGAYHSQYDDYTRMTKFGDPGFVYHAAAARIATAMLLRVANADVLPYDYVEYARTMRTYVPAIDQAISQRHWAASTTQLVTAIDRFEREAAAFNAARDAALRTTFAPAAAQRTNAALLRVERALTRPVGLRSRPWFRNLIYVADENNGYANMPLPSINEAIRANDPSLTQREINDLASRFDRAAQAVADARAALRAP
jgi:N-acetylated-alpha-linked acidic dipeptidase